jgi:two-component system response regulator YesN
MTTLYSVLIIDDEPIIVDVLHDLFLTVDKYELEIIRAFSAQEAIRILLATKVDVIFSDIRMPGMNGLELQQYVNRIWPHMKFIFLTGYNEFSYIQEAMRNNSMDYIMKNEDDETILNALYKALAELQLEKSNEQLLIQAKERFHQAIPKLREEFLFDLLMSQGSKSMIKQERFDELNLPLEAKKPVYMLLGKVDQWPQQYTFSDKTLMLYAVQNVAEEWTQSFGSMVSISYERNKLIWFIQAKEEGREKSLKGLIYTALDSIQTSCSQLFSIPLTIVMNASPVEWSHTGQLLAALMLRMNRGFGLDREIMILDEEATDSYTDSHEEWLTSSRVNYMEMLLDTGQKDVFLQEFKRNIGTILDLNTGSGFCGIQYYYALLSILLAYMGRRQLLNQEEGDALFDYRQLFSAAESSMEWSKRLENLYELIHLLFEQQTTERSKETHSVIQRAHEYIEEHLNSDLSLGKLANHVYLSPSYFSRLYKQETGKNISDYIVQRKLHSAMLYLKEPGMKIHEIAQQLGFDSAAYFTSFFKKHMNVTPQEYRSKS